MAVGETWWEWRLVINLLFSGEMSYVHALVEKKINKIGFVKEFDGS